MSKISFHGAAGTVTGSCFLLQNDSSKILIDCGMFQGSPELEKLNHEKFSFDAKNLSCVLLTHAHLDHCGRLPLLSKNGFSGKIYMTEATRALLEIALLDAAHVGEENGNALYSKEDVLKTLELSHVVAYDTPFELFGYEVNYVNAGHILGSASIIVKEKDSSKRFVFSGDLGNTPQDLIKPTEFVKEGDIVLLESTYGDTTHPSEDPYLILQKEINAIEENEGVLLIPAFSLERTQELLHRIDHLKRDKKIKEQTLVFLDSPMAISATDVFRRFKDLYNQELKEHEKIDDPFAFTGLTVVHHGKESEKIKDIKGAKVILAGSGMMTGGRIVSHAKTFLPLPSTRLLFVGYQAEHTLGRQIMEGSKMVSIYGQQIYIKATVTVSHSLSSHADQPRLLNWIKNISGVKQLFLIHGEDTPRAVLKDEISKTNNNLEILLPKLEESFEV